MMRRPSSTARSASRRVTRWRDAHSPILGSSYSAKPTITIGAGSDEPRFHGKTEFDRTSASTAAGSSAASSIEIPPPIEFPMSTTGPPPATSSTNLDTVPRRSLTRLRRPLRSVRPNPGRSIASTRPCLARPGATASHDSSDPPSPWTSTSVRPGGPSHST